MEEHNKLTNLPLDMLALIMKRLSLKDSFGLRAISRSCRQKVSIIIIDNKFCCHLPELPQVFLQCKNSRFLFNLSSEKVLHLRTPLSRSTNKDKCLGSVEGWLILSDYTEKDFAKIFFLNPVTNVRITIPSKLSLPSISSARGDRISTLRKMVASSKPNCDGSNCYLAGLLSDFLRIAIYKLFDKSWTIVEPDDDSKGFFTDVEIIGTKLYVSNSFSYSILVYDLKDYINGLSPKAKMLSGFPKIKQSSIISNHFLTFLAIDEKLRDLYFIYILCNAEHGTETQEVVCDSLIINSAFAKPPEITTFEVFKLINMNKKDPIRWMNVNKEDDDRVTFVADCKSIVMSRDELTYNKELIQVNSIYFSIYFKCSKNPWSGFKLGMFCLTDSNIKYFSVEKSKNVDVPYSLWFVPSLW